MKISELKNAPEWLVQANTENADVEITSWGWVIWNSGDFRGGNFLGGNFLGGNFRGGDFRGGSLYLQDTQITALPDNLTVGGDLYWRNERRHIDATVPEIQTPNLTWKDGKYTKIDGMFCEVISVHSWTIKGHDVTIIRAKKINKSDSFFIAKRDGFSAHGKTMESAVADLEFKAVAEQLKKEPIKADTEITIMYYRTITGACDFGCRDFMERNNIPFKIEEGKTVEVAPMKAADLLKILEKNNSYGLAAFKKLITF